MRLDYITIFPDWFAPLSLSLPGRAIESGLLSIAVHDLRDWTHDRHRTVDDTPYGGGAGMVLKPEPWGEALDAVLASSDAATLVVPTPSGRPFTQALARELATREHLVWACGRYEGIDQRVLDHAAGRPDVVEVVEVSLGDYVLNGGEVAALAITEAVVRLLPGFMGNAASLVEESHEDGLLEYPVYTKPASWRGLDVPDVLRSGDHARIAAWRHRQQVERTAARRPDLLPASQARHEWEVVPAVAADAGELLTLQRACWLQEAIANGSVEGIPALGESLDDVRRWLPEWTTYVVRVEGRLVGAVRGRLESTPGGPAWDIGRIMVAPDLQGRGLGRVLLEHIQDVAPVEATSFVLFTGQHSTDNIRMYRRAGFRLRPDITPPPLAVVLTKQRRPRAD
ncbi:tRNA (guanosine(37)-N1)-methyltransferase TrmD [Nocardioides dongxiaopingii]|uniref:tRNA (guanosine(37)-N1)-methyltransferase TrmD n=1 Tax=Nocardioides dongxiaopingii TaxID=2576036 RepID=UPI0010C76C4A|nr:tRNA (guanosine(37)-N1)-methyltransferase TrmD [Nocardioides dongxiaopingii]